MRACATTSRCRPRGLDELVAALQDDPSVYGARLTGAGFGGCCVALVEGAAAAGVARSFDGWIVRPSAGAHVTTGG